MGLFESACILVIWFLICSCGLGSWKRKAQMCQIIFCDRFCRDSSLVFTDGRLKKRFLFSQESYKDLMLSFSYVIVSQKTYTRDEGTICLGRGNNFYLLSLRKTFFNKILSQFTVGILFPLNFITVSSSLSCLFEDTCWCSPLKTQDPLISQMYNKV